GRPARAAARRDLLLGCPRRGARRRERARRRRTGLTPSSRRPVSAVTAPPPPFRGPARLRLFCLLLRVRVRLGDELLPAAPDDDEPARPRGERWSDDVAQ